MGEGVNTVKAQRRHGICDPHTECIYGAKGVRGAEKDLPPPCVT